MSYSRRLFQRLWSRKRAARSDMREELQYHIDARVAHLMVRGMSAQEAREEAIHKLGSSLAEAERRLGDSAERKERRLDVRDRLYDIITDARYAVRGLARRPGFTAVAVLTLAIGIGANTAIYTAVDALLLRSLPFHEPGRLMDITQSTDNSWNALWSYPRYLFFRNAQRSYSTLALYRSTQTTLTGTDPERLTVEEVTTEYLPTLGVRASLGNDLPAELDNAPGARRVALISDALWQRRYNSDPNVLGQTLSLNNQPWEIAGVLPPGFKGLSGRAEAIVNLSARVADELKEAWSLEFSMLGRLKDGLTAEQAAAEARQLGPRIYEAFPMEKGSLTTSKEPQRWSAAARPLDTIRVASGVKRSLLVLVRRRRLGPAHRLRESREPAHRTRACPQAGDRGTARDRCRTRQAR